MFNLGRYWQYVISAKVVSVLAVSARIPGSNSTVGGYFFTSSLSKHSEIRGGYCSVVKVPSIKNSAETLLLIIMVSVVC